MSNIAKVTAATVMRESIPSLKASVKVLLADPFSLGDEIPRWQPPEASRVPDRREVVTAIDALKALLEPAPSGHVGFWVTTMAKSMAMRQGQTADMASRTDGWLLACGELPADLWTEGCKELLRTKTFMPSPGELMGLVERKFGERRRMLKRAEWLIGVAPDASKPKPFVPDDRKTSLPLLIKSARATGRHVQAVKYETELAALEGRAVADWATAPIAVTPKAAPEAEPARVPTLAETEMREHMARLAREHRARQGFGTLDAMAEAV